MTRTLTLPITDRSMWRRLVAKTHPDAGGDHELFIWTGALRDAVCGRERVSRRRDNSTPPRSDEGPARVPYPAGSDFAALTARALAMAEEIGGVHGSLLLMLADCEAPPSTIGAWEQRGASYKKLAAIGHTVAMTKAERISWYRVAEAVPLSDRHAGHILGRLKKSAA